MLDADRAESNPHRNPTDEEILGRVVPPLREEDHRVEQTPRGSSSGKRVRRLNWDHVSGATLLSLSDGYEEEIEHLRGRLSQAEETIARLRVERDARGGAVALTIVMGAIGLATFWGGLAWLLWK